MGLVRYRLLEHTADLAYEVEAGDWGTLLSAAVGALGDLILKDDGTPPDERRPVSVEGADREDVLVAWLSEALFLYERTGFLVRGALVEVAEETKASGQFVGRVTSLAYEPPDRVVKAVTYHDLHVRTPTPTRPTWQAAVVLDL